LSSVSRIAINGFLDLLGDDLAAVEEGLTENAISSVPVITDIARYVQRGGGKRIRAAIVLLCTKLFSHSDDMARRFAVIVETVHAATLVHDDIIDDAKVRRGRPAANIRWGNSSCVLAGDWLYMQAVKLACEAQNSRLIDVMNDAAQKMIEGELLELASLGKCISMEEYERLISCKTACLFAASAHAGAIIGRTDPEIERRMEQYGHNLGMAFQIIDDVLDLTASEEVLGKPVASDLREGKATIAIIHALQHATPAERGVIETVLRERSLSNAQHRQITEILHRYGSIDHGTRIAYSYADRACDEMCDLPDSEVKGILLCLPEFVVRRQC
jgi:octaprenyl-diphosphate synthase